MYRGWRDASIALLGVNFDNEFEKEDPPSLIDCQIFNPYKLVGGVWEIAVAATEAPGAALSNQLRFIKMRDRRQQTSHVVMGRPVM